MKRLLLIVLFLVGTGMGCATTGVSNSIGSSYLAIDGVADVIAMECGHSYPGGPCLSTSQISTADKQALKQKLLVAKTAVDDAERLRLLGEIGQSRELLAWSASILSSVTQILLERGVQ